MLASSSILTWVRNRFTSSIWTAMAIYPSPMSWQLLEDYLLHALKKANQYTARACVGKLDDAFNQLQVLHLGQCTGTSLKSDCTAAVIAGPDLIAFHSSDKRHPLYDMIYKVESVYHAFQVPVGKSYAAKQRQITLQHRTLFAMQGLSRGFVAVCFWSRRRPAGGFKLKYTSTALKQFQ